MKCAVVDGERYVKDLFARLESSAKMEQVNSKQGTRSSTRRFVEFHGRVTLTWWVAARSNKGTVGISIGTVEGAEGFYLRMMEMILWDAREWDCEVRTNEAILVEDTKVKIPVDRRGVWVVGVRPIEGRMESRIMNLLYGEDDWRPWLKKGITMPFWQLGLAVR